MLETLLVALIGLLASPFIVGAWIFDMARKLLGAFSLRRYFESRWGVALGVFLTLIVAAIGLGFLVGAFADLESAASFGGAVSGLLAPSLLATYLIERRFQDEANDEGINRDLFVEAIRTRGELVVLINGMTQQLGRLQASRAELAKRELPVDLPGGERTDHLVKADDSAFSVLVAVLAQFVDGKAAGVPGIAPPTFLVLCGDNRLHLDFSIAVQSAVSSSQRFNALHTELLRVHEVMHRSGAVTGQQFDPSWVVSISPGERAGLLQVFRIALDHVHESVVRLTDVVRTLEQSVNSRFGGKVRGVDFPIPSFLAEDPVVTSLRRSSPSG